MKTFTKRILLPSLVFLFTLCSGIVNAQWNTNTSVNLQISGLGVADMVSVPTSDGKIWIAFYHQNGGSYDMRAQLIDADGYKLLGPDGILVSNQPTGTATFVFNACIDASNNFIIGCQDERTGVMQAVVYKISQAGTQLWNPTGIILGEGLAPYPCALTNGEVVVTWNESQSNTLNMQKITASGTLAWTTPISILVGTSTTTRGQIVANLNDKFTMVYQKNAGGISTNLYAQMFNSSGVAQYAPLQIGNQTTAGYRYYSITAEADTTYFGYYSSTGFRFNSFLQRINPNGTIPYGMNGSAFNTYTSGTDNYQMETSIGMKPGSSYVWSVCSFCDPNQTNYGVYVQKFNKVTGARQFTDMGKIVYPITASRDTKAGEIVIVDDNPMFMSYNSNYKIFATRLDESGNFAWQGNRVEISSTTSTVGKGRFGFTAAGPNKCAGVWTEDRGPGDMGYAQGISVGGLIGIDVTTQGGVPATITTAGATLQLVATVYPITANQSVTWSIIPVTGNATIDNFGLVSGLVDGTVWAKAVSVADITMADSILITLSGQIPVPPTVITLPANNITLTGATIHGSVNANYYNSAASFEWGLTNTYGNIATATPSQVTGNTVTPVSASLSGLASGTTYHFRCVGVNTGGTTNGQDLTFTTQCLLAGSIGTISGPGSVCATSTGNVYSIPAFPGATSYVWALPAGATITAGNNTNSITVSYSPTAQSGSFSVYATDGTCISLTTPPYPVAVSPVPVQAGPISGVQVVCEGEQGIQYTIEPLPGVSTYIWTVPPGAVIASGQNTTSIFVNYNPGSVSGNITVYGTNECGTGAVSNPLPIDIYPLPAVPGAISGPDHICAEANDIQYSVAPVTNAFGYVWTVPAGAVITAGANTNQITVHFTTAALSGNITVYGTNGNCLGETSSPLFVTVAQIPPTPVITRHGDTLVSSASSGNQWYLEGNLIPGATGVEYIATEGGNYTVIVTLNGCSSAVSNIINVLPVGINNISFNKSIEVFPNPNKGWFTIKGGSLQKVECTLQVFNSIGAMIWERKNVLLDGSFAIPVDLNTEKPGGYLLVLRTPDQTVCKKISIVK
jgi:hypothetical protein